MVALLLGWSGLSSAQSIRSALPSSETSEDTPTAGEEERRQQRGGPSRSFSHRTPTDGSEFGVGGLSVPDEEEIEEIEARCRRPPQERRGNDNNRTTHDIHHSRLWNHPSNTRSVMNNDLVNHVGGGGGGGFNEDGLKAAMETVKSKTHAGLEIDDEKRSSAAMNIVEKNPLPLCHYEELLNFNLEKLWRPFDESLKSLALPDAVELAQPTIVKPDGRQELIYKDGHREIIFRDKTRKVVVSGCRVI